MKNQIEKLLIKSEKLINELKRNNEQIFILLDKPIQKEESKKSNKKPYVEKLKLDGSLVKRFRNVAMASKSSAKVTKQGIYNCLNGRTQSHAGFRWKYSDER